MLSNLSSSKQGNIGMTRAIYEYSKLGYHIFLPFAETEKYDFVMDDGEKLLKVQVKTSRYKRYRGYRVNIGGTHGQEGRKDKDYDLLFALLDNDQCYSIPVSHLRNTHNVSLGNGNFKQFLLK